jgi:hypothetical protein
VRQDAATFGFTLLPALDSGKLLLGTATALSVRQRNRGGPLMTPAATGAASHAIALDTFLALHGVELDATDEDLAGWILELGCLLRRDALTVVSCRW